MTEAGAKVRTGEAYKVIWNPAPSESHRADSRGPRKRLPAQTRRPPSSWTDRATTPPKHPSFRVPSATPPGIYLVLIYDGSEGGSHATWDYVQIRGRPEPTATASGSSGADGGGQGALAAAFGVGVCASLVSLVVLRRRRANGD